MSGRNLRDFLLEEIPDHPHDIAKFASVQYGVSRQVVNRHLRELADEGYITAVGNTRAREYHLALITEVDLWLDLTSTLQEDVVWREHIKPKLAGIHKNALGICIYGFTEMLNNAIDHSEGSRIYIRMEYTAKLISFILSDNGVGIFKKIKRECNLEDEQHAILELAKGKLTTDPSRHSGQGIFFTSRMFDRFAIMSGKLFFSHRGDFDWLLSDEKKDHNGTFIQMDIDPDTSRTAKGVFDMYVTDHEEYGFTKTIVPVVLADYGEDNLVSRSQAKRLVARFEHFTEVMLDFDKVETIGQAFADELFRVFPLHHPDTHLLHINANQEVEQMIRRAKADAGPPLPRPGAMNEQEAMPA